MLKGPARRVGPRDQGQSPQGARRGRRRGARAGGPGGSRKGTPQVERRRAWAAVPKGWPARRGSGRAEGGPAALHRRTEVGTGPSPGSRVRGAGGAAPLGGSDAHFSSTLSWAGGAFFLPIREFAAGPTERPSLLVVPGTRELQAGAGGGQSRRQGVRAGGLGPVTLLFLVPMIFLSLLSHVSLK